MNFGETERYLLSLGNEVSAMKLGLENVSRLLSALGDPQNGYIKVQVAGTNGKGSVCAFLDAICCSAGLTTGLFTSPHLISITERIRINGADISEDEFARHASRVRETAEQLVGRGEIANTPTFFEQVTATALTAFAEAGVQVAVLETGLGGRLDATTAARAEICGITQIALDHQEYLGESVEEIAAEKAAIIHLGCRAVIAEQLTDAMQVILDRCTAVGVVPLFAQDVTTGGNMSGDECAGTTSFSTGKETYRARLSLRGRHQISNAKVAILLAEVLVKEFPQIKPEHIIAGLKTARHPGRLEMIGNVLLDGAHNVAGARALAVYIDTCISRPVTVVYAAMNGKDVSGVAEILFPRAANIILTQPSNSRAMKPAAILDAIGPTAYTAPVTIEPSTDTALGRAMAVAGGDGLVLVTGSLYLVGEAKKILNN